MRTYYVLTGLFGAAWGYQQYTYDRRMQEMEVEHLNRKFKMLQKRMDRYEQEQLRILDKVHDLKFDLKVKKELNALKRYYDTRLARQSHEGPFKKFLNLLGIGSSPEETEYFTSFDEIEESKDKDADKKTGK